MHYSMHNCDEMEGHVEWVMPPPHPHLKIGKLVNGPIIKIILEDKIHESPMGQGT